MTNLKFPLKFLQCFTAMMRFDPVVLFDQVP